jgi:hypothetical protein
MTPVCKHIPLDASTAVFVSQPPPRGAHNVRCPCCGGVGYIRDDDTGPPMECPDCEVEVVRA